MGIPSSVETKASKRKDKMKRFILALFCFSTFFDFSHQRDSIVDINGKGDFTSITDCVRNTSAGDSCLVKEGRYHEEIIIDGKEDIAIKGFQDERPVIDGTIVLKPNNNKKWNYSKKKKHCFAKINIAINKNGGKEIFQLFLDGEMMTNARWPNALWTDKTTFDEHYWGHSDPSSTRGTMVDSGELAASGLNMTGAMAVLNVGSFNTFVKPVLWHEPGSNNFTYEDDFGKIKFVPRENRYYLDSKLELLDNPGEWHYDKTTSILRFIPFNGTCPDGKSDRLRGRTIDYSMKITKTKGLMVKNVDFFASTVEAIGFNKFHEIGSIDNITFDSVNFDFPSSSKRMLQDPSMPKTTEIQAKIFGTIRVENCRFTGAEGFALRFSSTNSKIYNNLFEWNDWSGHMTYKNDGGGGTVVSHPGSRNTEFIGNTLWYNGASAGYRPGIGGIIKDNIFAGQCKGNIMNDGAGLQIMTKQQNQAKVERNWAFDSPKYGLRFDGAPKCDPKCIPLGRYGTFSKNVAWDCGGIQVKGDNHNVTENLALEYSPDIERTVLKVVYILREYTTITNNETRVENNAAAVSDGGQNKHSWGPKPKWDIAGIKENNYVGIDLKSLLEDFDNQDFRPKSKNIFTQKGNGSIIGEATENQIGPYPPVGEEITQYIIPGQKLDVASHPIPNDKSTVPKRDAIMFRPGFRCSSHDVYVSSTNNQTLPETPRKTLSKDADGEHNNVVMINATDEGKYRWRVDCKDEETGKIRRGKVWMFTIKK